MTAQCPNCGGPLMFVHQYQRWFCQHCQQYAEPVMPLPPTQGFQPPAYAPEPGNAIYWLGFAVSRRTEDDRMLSKWLVYAILVFQVLVPVATLLALYFILENIDTLEMGGFLALMAVLIATSVGLAAMQSLAVYRMVSSRDSHFRRDAVLRSSMLMYLDAMSIRLQKDINVERWTMNTLHTMYPEGERGAGLWAALVALVVIIPIVGIILLFYCLHFLTKDIHEHHRRQMEFNRQFGIALSKLGISPDAGQAWTGGALTDWPVLPRRDTGVYAVLGIITVGYFLPYWWYADIVDMNAHLAGQWQYEDRVLAPLLRQGAER